MLNQKTCLHKNVLKTQKVQKQKRAKKRAKTKKVQKQKRTKKTY